MNRKFMLFFGPDTGVEAGSATDLLTPETEGQQQEGQQQAAEPVKPAVPDWQEPMQQLIKTVTEANKPKEVQRQPTQDEINAHWGIYDPSKSRPDFFAKFFNLADPNDELSLQEKKELFAEMQKGLVGQSIVGARNILMEEIQKIRDEFAPVQQHMSEQRALQTKTDFYTQNESLKEFSKVVDSVAAQLRDKKFDTRESYFKALSEGAAEIIKLTKPDFALGAKPNPTNPVKTPRLPRTSAGGTGGSGGGAGAAIVKTADDDSGDIDWA